MTSLKRPERVVLTTRREAKDTASSVLEARIKQAAAHSNSSHHNRTLVVDHEAKRPAAPTPERARARTSAWYYDDVRTDLAEALAMNDDKEEEGDSWSQRERKTPSSSQRRAPRIPPLLLASATRYGQGDAEGDVFDLLDETWRCTRCRKLMTREGALVDIPAKLAPCVTNTHGAQKLLARMQRCDCGAMRSLDWRCPDVHCTGRTPLTSRTVEDLYVLLASPLASSKAFLRCLLCKNRFAFDKVEYDYPLPDAAAHPD